MSPGKRKYESDATDHMELETHTGSVASPFRISATEVKPDPDSASVNGSNNWSRRSSMTLEATDNAVPASGEPGVQQARVQEMVEQEGSLGIGVENIILGSSHRGSKRQPMATSESLNIAPESPVIGYPAHKDG